MEKNDNFNKEILRFTSAGSVDDGKSTLIGRLLYDSNAIFDDQLNQIKNNSFRKGISHIDFSLLTDGLKDEREQGITIDVAYRYFATSKRKFIIADTPGHIQYTMNMITGASTANLALILVDARKGIVEQTYRHSFIAALLKIPNIIICVNKMDLVNFNKDVFDVIIEQYEEFSINLNVKNIKYIPISALNGDFVVNRSKKMDWYSGPTLMNYLEDIQIDCNFNQSDPRFHIQTVIRPQSNEYRDFRGYAGRIDAGVYNIGDEVLCLPSNQRTKIKEIFLGSTPVKTAFAPMSVNMTLEDDIDICRGNVLVKPTNSIKQSTEIVFMGCWFNSKPLSMKTKYTILHGCAESVGKISELHFKLDISNLKTNVDSIEIGFNDIFKAKLRMNQPLLFDSYQHNKKTGSFIIVDQATNETLGVGMIV